MTVFILLLAVAGWHTVLVDRQPLPSSCAGEITASPPRAEETAAAGLLCQVFSIVSTGNDYLMAGERQFILNPGSVLEDLNKNPLTLEDLPLPCRASICYYLKPNRPEAHLLSLTLMPEG